MTHRRPVVEKMMMKQLLAQDHKITMRIAILLIVHFSKLILRDILVAGLAHADRALFCGQVQVKLAWRTRRTDEPLALPAVVLHDVIHSVWPIAPCLPLG